MKITSVTDVFRLPKTLHLLSGGFEVSFTPEDLAECTLVLLNHEVDADFQDQAEVIAYAGNHFDFGEWQWGRPYETASGECAQ